MYPDTFIVIDIELSFKCNPEVFEKIYQEEYKGKITHRFIRSGLNLSDSVGLKLNGTFERWLYLIDENSCLYRVRIGIQTALWFNVVTGKWQYVSIFPNFIKRWYQPCLNMLEYISLKVGKGEDILKHIDDPKELILCEDCIAGAIKRLEISCAKLNVEALLNSRYTQIFNKPIPAKNFREEKIKRFPRMYSLIITARYFFGTDNGVLARLNTKIHL